MGSNESVSSQSSSASASEVPTEKIDHVPLETSLSSGSNSRLVLHVPKSKLICDCTTQYAGICCVPSMHIQNKQVPEGKCRLFAHMWTLYTARITDLFRNECRKFMSMRPVGCITGRSNCLSFWAWKSHWIAFFVKLNECVPNIGGMLVVRRCPYTLPHILLMSVLLGTCDGQ